MENIETDDVENESEQSEGKTRVKPGARIIYYWAGAVINGKLVWDTFGSHSEDTKVSKEQALAFNEVSARDAFYQKYNCKPEVIDGPFHRVKCLNVPAPAPSKRETVAIAPTEVKFTTECQKCNYRGWSGLAWGIQDHSDFMYFIPETEINPDGRKKTPPMAKMVMISSLNIENI